ncbi:MULTISPECIES: MFS transporter [unclassified Parafrankia]|uniref:MFS transporter n=1 Tax=unclassified Parafrankia TaxID=2994368 RepID=UPI000DA4A664|nr:MULTISPECIES: MFS transporter [unclassified Parafrankia]TCJ34370.1 MFS transporter [Parafrankia sp. BMG5.11]SQD95693.1 Major facilitator superfamily MFS_1 [Parafrankia sp. Ea1.12]
MTPRAAGIQGPGAGPEAASAGLVVLPTLAAAQFLMTLDSSVMNVSIATVAADIGTTVTGIQTAITFYTLVMAAFMITGGRLGQLFGHRRVFTIGCVVYGCGSLTTSVAGNLAVLMFGWSFLEGVGAALIMPAVVALVASNFASAQRPRAYGLVAAAGAIAVAAGPLVGGLFTTYLSWRWVFAGEVLVVGVILWLTRGMADTPPTAQGRLDIVGTVLSAAGLALIVYGVLRSGSWGLVRPAPGAPVWLGLSPVIWLALAGGTILLLFVRWQDHRLARGAAALLDPVLLRNRTFRAGLTSFFFQYLLQAGLFFVVPLYLSVALGLSAVATGVRLLPLSIALLVAAVGIPKALPHVSPRRIVRGGFLSLFAGTTILIAALDAGAGPEIVTWPMLLAGLGVGALASQLGSVTVSAVADEHTGEVGGVQNTVTNLGASIGTAAAGAVLISALTSSFLTGVRHDPAVPAELSTQAEVRLAEGVPFLSDRDLKIRLDEAGVPPDTAKAITATNADARLDGLRAALSLLAAIALAAMFLTRQIPDRQSAPAPASGRVT